MKRGTTMGLLVTVCVLGGVLWLAERDQSAAPVRRQVGKPLCPWVVGSVQALNLRVGTEQSMLVRRDGEWFLESPVRGRADSGQVERLLGGLESLKRLEIVSEVQRAQRGLTLRDYGLVDPEMVIGAYDGTVWHEVRLGREAPLGDSAYVMLGSGPEVIATRKDVLQLVPRGVDVLRDRQVLPGATERVTRLELHRAGRGFLRLTREQGRWRLQQPVSDRADAGMVGPLLDDLFALRARTFEWDRPTGTNASLQGESDYLTRLESYGLADDEASARIILRLDSDLLSYELIVGKVADATGGTLFAKRRDLDTVITIPAADLGLLVTSADALRERNLFDWAPDAVRQVSIRRGDRKLELSRGLDDRWMITQPVQWRADPQAVRDLIQALTKWRALAFVEGAESVEAEAALATPYCTLRLSTAVKSPGLNGTEAGPPAPDEVTLVVGVATGVMPAVYTRFETNSAIQRLSISALGAFGPDPLEPLAYRDRTVLAVPPTDVQRITLDCGGGEETVVRGAAGDWQALALTNAMVAPDVVSDVLYFFSGLRANRAEIHNPPDLRVYGLDAGGCVITLGLTGETGIQKSLVLGGQAPDGGLYVMVKGQDVVYTLSTTITDLLRRNLLMARP